MEYFSEIYGDYYRAVAAVLRKAAIAPLTEKEISQIVAQNAFGESALYITPALTGGRWPLLVEREGKYYPVTKNVLPEPMTALQRGWLACLLEDERIAAFFDPEEIQQLRASLDCPPLYDGSALLTVDACSDHDPWDEEKYAAVLRTMIEAAKSCRSVRVGYTGARGQRVTGEFVPVRLEYSPKDDKIRARCVRLRKGEPQSRSVLNLARIDQVELTETVCQPGQVEQIFEKSVTNGTAVVEITDERNALERFMVQFSSYDKHTRLEENGIYTCTLSYDTADETELVIRLLSFGPMVRVISPAGLAAQLAERIARQLELLG